MELTIHNKPMSLPSTTYNLMQTSIRLITIYRLYSAKRKNLSFSYRYKSSRINRPLIHKTLTTVDKRKWIIVSLVNLINNIFRVAMPQLL